MAQLSTESKKCRSVATAAMPPPGEKRVNAPMKSFPVSIHPKIDEPLFFNLLI